jgi:hypothetical protein
MSKYVIHQLNLHVIEVTEVPNDISQSFLITEIDGRLLL